ncbi:MAG: hypothetical protein R3C05_14760 [Pirellulaceae bacterium]
MSRHLQIRNAVQTVFFGLCLSQSPGVDADDYFDETSVRTIFAFDSRNIPFAQNVRLEMHSPTKHPANPVLKRGERGSVDALAVQFYGSIIRVDDRYRMWYVAASDETDESSTWSQRWRPAYAESEDGIHWTKPRLGLVRFAGDRQNNLVRIDPEDLGCINLKVIHDPHDPDLDRRYKMTMHVYFRDKRRLGTLAALTSPDGLNWKMTVPAKAQRGDLPIDSVVLPPVHFEPCGGLYLWRGTYFACGQNAMNAPRSYQGRITRMYRSRDFIHWFPTSHIGFVRTNQHGALGAGRSLEGEQTHEGISVWNRSNVLLGVYGRWHGAERIQDVTIDLGLVLSNDGLNFREPQQEWTFLERGAKGEWDAGGLLQGQGFENVGDQTFIYYGAWNPADTGGDEPAPRGGVGIAVLPRDRFADLRVEQAGLGPGDYQLPTIRSEFVTAAIKLDPRTDTTFHCNASGLSKDGYLKIEILDVNEQPLPDYRGTQAAIVTQSGFQTPVLWNGQQSLASLPEYIRLRVVFAGPSNDSIRFHALYVRNATP